MNWPTRLRRLSASLLSASALLLTTGCEDPSNIQVELPGTVQTGTQYEDLPVTASTVRRDTLPTLNANRFMVGRVRDNSTGIVTAAQVYANLQVGTDSLPSNFAGATLDSVVMALSFERTYGSSAQPGRFDLLPLRQKLDVRTAYNSTSSVAVGTPILTNAAASFNRTQVDTARTTGSVPTRVLRMPIRTGFSNSLFGLLQDASFNQAKLDAFWQGYSLVPAAGYTGAVATFYPAGSFVYVYYHDSKNRQRIYPLYTARNNDARFFTRITTDLSGAGPLARLTNQQQTVSAAETSGVTYIQDGIGITTKFEVPGLERLRSQTGVSINRAELLIPVKPFANSLFPYPGNESLNNPTATNQNTYPKTYLYEADAATNRILRRVIANQPVNRLVQASGSNQQSQVYSTTGVGSQAEGTLYNVDATTYYYSVLMTSYVQAYLLNQLGGDLPSAFLFSPSLSLPRAYQPNVNVSLNRAVLDANNIKLRVYFTSPR